MKKINKPELSAKTPDMAMLSVQFRKNYGGQYKALGVILPCYTKKQMRSLYPGNSFERVAEYAPDSKKDKAGVLCHEKENLTLTKYGSNSRIQYREKGFVAVDSGEDSYVAILQNVLLSRIAAFALCLVLIAGGVLLAINLGKDAVVVDAVNTPISPELEEGAVEWEGAKSTEESGIPADGIRIPGYKSITIEADTTEVSVNLQNPEKNSCYFVIRLVLLDTGETLYESKMIEPGKGLYNITLSRALEAGTYSAQLQYEPYDITTMTRLNGAVVNLDLIVE